MAQRFAREGATVVVADLIYDRAVETAAMIVEGGGDALAVQADVSESAQVTAMVEGAIAAYGKVDILVNNAGISSRDNVLAIEEDDWDHTFDVVLKSVYLCSKAVLPGMIERRTGAILNITVERPVSGSE